MLRLLRRFGRNEAGNFAIITALCAVPVMGMAGLGVDFSQAYSAKATLQGEADAIAIAVASEGPDAKSRFYAPMTAEAAARVSLGKAQFSGTWTSRTEYVVSASAQVPRTLSRLIPVGKETITVGVEAVARYEGARLVYKAPETLFLDPLAWDYNRVDAYCFNAQKGKSNKSAGRGQFTSIADNNGGKYTTPLPQCGVGEVMSFRLFNVIEGKHNPNNMKNANNNNNYYTDTTRSGDGPDTHNLTSDILETILCPTLAVCKEEPAGIIPVGSGRVPKKNTKPCTAGSYMYYGWEDRPNGDRDFNDIRIIIGCPATEKAGDESVQLIR